VIYLDTGCLLKLYYPEPESVRVAAIVQGKPIIYNQLHELELANALQLKLFLRNATAGQVAAARSLVASDLTAGVLVPGGGGWDGVFKEAVALAERYTSTIGCRSLDILHCTAAKVVGAAEFVSTDERQKKLAVAMGLHLTAV
jgi:predicted nucleic acid-binding protein